MKIVKEEGLVKENIYGKIKPRLQKVPTNKHAGKRKMKKGEGDAAMCRESVKEDFRGLNRKRIKLVHFRIFL